MQQSNTYIIIFALLMTIFFGTLLSFTRMQLGDGIEKKEDDFAGEVAAAINKN